MTSPPTAAFSYYGGKQRMARHIVALFPPHTVYVETHAGGLAVLFVKGQPRTSNGHDYREVINDTDSRIVNFYRCLQDSVTAAELQERLKWTPYSREEHATAKALLQSGTGTSVEQAWAWYVKIQQSFGNILHGGWRTSVVSRNQADTWYNAKQKFPLVCERLAHVHIEHLDQVAVIKKWDSPQTLFYCDPPYVGANQGHYAGYTQADFDALLAALDASSSSFVLSCYDNPALAQYSAWERFTFSAHSSVNGKGQTGSGRDKTRPAIAEELGNRSRTELVFRRISFAPLRATLRSVTRQFGQGQLF